MSFALLSRVNANKIEDPVLREMRKKAIAESLDDDDSVEFEALDTPPRLTREVICLSLR